MTLMRWQSKNYDPFTDLLDLHNEISRALDLPMRRGAEASPARTAWFPPVDILVEEENLRVRAEIPGMTKDNLDISISGDVLTIKGEKKQEKESKERNYYRSERFYGSFQRLFVLPCAVKADKVSAEYANGVLEITLPKKEEEKTQQIQVNMK